MKIFQFLSLSLLFSFQNAFGLTVIIDPGHGGKDKGGTYGKIYEKHLALETVLRLKDYLKKRGYQVILTRDYDYFLSLQRRVDISNSYSDAVFLSLHYNYFNLESVQGIETFYSTGKSKALAFYIQKEILKKLPFSIHRRVRKSGLFVTKNNKHPSALVECGFISHQGERNSIKTAKYRQNIAEAIGNGIIRYHKYSLKQRKS